MMLHRHFEEGTPENITKLHDVSVEQEEEYVSEIFPPEEVAEKKPARKRKTESE